MGMFIVKAWRHKVPSDFAILIDFGMPEDIRRGYDEMIAEMRGDR